MTSPTTLGTLVLAATPIGNPRDASPRLRDELARADVLAAEGHPPAASARGGPRGGGRRGPQLPRAQRGVPDRELVDRLLEGDRVVLVTDAGNAVGLRPRVPAGPRRDPVGVPVTCVPGPSAVLMALAVSGMPVDRFCFEGFPPRKPGERARALGELCEERRTMVFFEAPHRLATTLTAMADAFGSDRGAAVCRGADQDLRGGPAGTLAELAAWAEENARGEITVVVSGRRGSSTEVGDVLPGILERVAAGERLQGGLCRRRRTDRAVQEGAVRGGSGRPLRGANDDRHRRIRRGRRGADLARGHGEGEPLVLLHGAFGGASSFHAQTPALVAAAFRVHVPERRGTCIRPTSTDL